MERFSHLEARNEGEGDPEMLEFEAECDQLVGYGVSPSEAIDAGTVGLREWDVHIDPVEFSTMEPHVLCGEVNSAIRLANGDYAARVRALRRKFFDTTLS